MNNLPSTLMKDRIDLYGFSFPSESGSKTKAPILKKKSIRAMVQDTPPEIITWYFQREELVTDSAYLIDKFDYDLINIKDRIVFNGNNFRVAGKTNQAGLNRVFRVDLRAEVA